MKIAVGTKTFPKISETFVLGPIKAMLDRGHDVRIFSLREGDREHVHPIVREYELLQRSSVLQVPSKLGRLFGSRRSPGSFDAIYVHFGNVAEEFRRMREQGVLAGPLYPVFHGYDISSRVRQDPHVYDRLLDESAGLLPISELWKKRLLELGAAQEKIFVHRMGIDLDAFPFSPKKRGPGEPLRLLSVARLVEKKGLEFSLSALASFKQQYPELPFEYTIAGDGPLKGSLTRRSKDLGLSGMVTFVGNQPADEVTRLYRKSDVFLLPSVTSSTGDMEGLPVVLMEAMARGVPVIATQHSGIPELVTRESGFLVPERDPEAISSALSQLLVQPDSALSLRQNARKAVEVSHDVETNTEQLLRFFAQTSSRSTG